MTQELATIEGTLTPAEFSQGLADAQVKAKSLTEIVEAQKLFTMISGRKHLRVEAWQTIGMGYGLTAAVHTTEILYQDNVEVGAKAGVLVYDRQGVVRGGAEAYCMCNEGDWGSRNSNQRISMAGTRATSKALRLLLSWVVVLAGYEPTPAEEMTSDIKRDVQADDLGMCETHSVRWRENRNGDLYHRTENDGWCNPPKNAQPPLESAPMTAGGMPSAEKEMWVALRNEVEGEGWQWDEWETAVLEMPYAKWVRLGKTANDARERYLDYQSQQDQE